MPEQPRITIQGADQTGPAFRSVHDALMRLAAQANAASGRMVSLGNLGRMGLSILLAPLRAMQGIFGVLSGVVGTAFRTLGSLAGVAGQAFGGLLHVVTGLAGAIGGALWSSAQRVFGYLSTGAKVAAVGVAASLMALGKHGVSINLEVGGVERGLGIMLRSRQLAGALVGAMRQYAEQSVSTFTQIANWGRSLVAFGFGAGQVIPMLRTLGDTAAGLNMDAGGMERLILALGQMRAKGMVTGEESMQLMEAGLPVRRYLGVPEGRDIADMRIPAMVGIQRILAGMRQDFGGMQQGAMATLPGIWSNILDVVDRLSAKVTTGLLGGLTRAGKAALDFLGNLENTRSGQVILQGLESLFTGIGNAVAGLAARLPQVAQWVASAFQSGEVRAFFARIVEGVKTGIGWLNSFRIWAVENWPAIWKFAGQWWDWFKQVLKMGLEWIRDNWRKVWDSAVSLLDQAARGMVGTWAGLQAAWGVLVTWVQQNGAAMWEGLLSGVRAFGQAFVYVFSYGLQLIGLTVTGIALIAQQLITVARLQALLAPPSVRRWIHEQTDLALPTVNRALEAGPQMFNWAGAFRDAAGGWLQQLNPHELAQSFMQGIRGTGSLGRAFADAYEEATRNWQGIGARLGLPKLPELTPLPTAPEMPRWPETQAPVPTTAAPAPPPYIEVPGRRGMRAGESGGFIRPEFPATEYNESPGPREAAIRSGSKATADAAQTAADHLRMAAAALEKLPRDLQRQATRDVALAWGGGNIG